MHTLPATARHVRLDTTGRHYAVTADAVYVLAYRSGSAPAWRKVPADGDVAQQARAALR